MFKKKSQCSDWSLDISFIYHDLSVYLCGTMHCMDEVAYINQAFMNGEVQDILARHKFGDSLLKGQNKTPDVTLSILVDSP